MKNFIILLLTVYILSCATAPPPRILDDGFISSQPNFQVQFHKPIVEKSVKSQRAQQVDINTYYFFVNNTEGILIEIQTYIASRSGFDFYGPEQVLTNMGCMVLGPVIIDGRQWIKFVDVFNNNFLFTGYFRIMDNSFISVGRICNAGADAEEIGSFRKGTSLSYGQVKLWDEAFAHTDQLFSIGMVAPAKSQSERPLSAKEIKTTPEKAKTEAERPPLEKDKPKVAAIPKDVSIVRVSLRKKPIEISNQMRITDMLIEHDFFDRSRNPYGSFENVLIDNSDGTVTDKTTGLMWQKSGSSSSLENRGAKEYIKQLNRKRFAGHSDWRIPTVEELASLLERRKKSGVHIAPIFDNKQARCWTIDNCDPLYSEYLGSWIVDFKQGIILQAEYKKMDTQTGQYTKNTINYVKAVRSVK